MALYHNQIVTLLKLFAVSDCVTSCILGGFFDEYSEKFNKCLSSLPPKDMKDVTSSNKSINLH